MPTGTWAGDWATGDIVVASEYRKSMGCVADSTLGVAAASFDFTGLPTGYAHLRIVALLRGDTAAVGTSSLLRLNNDAAANYDKEGSYVSGAGQVILEALAGTSVDISQQANIPAATATAGYFAGLVVDIPAYGQTTANKTLTATGHSRTGTGAGAGFVWTTGGLWRSSAAVNRITISPGAGNWIAGCRCSIYVMGS